MKNRFQISLVLAIVTSIFCCPFAIIAQKNVSADSIMQITTRLPGHTKPSKVTVHIEDGMAIMQGDIELGPIEALLDAPVQNRSLVIEDLEHRWFFGVIPYEIDEAFTREYRDTILAAIQYIKGSTNLLMRPREASDFFWIDFKSSNKCSSAVGLQQFGGQAINLQDFTTNAKGEGCYFIQIIHEIAHAAGLWHEQSRSDRDEYVDILWDNIEKDKERNFEMDTDERMDFGPYDYNSRMHYFSDAFAKRDGLITIVRKRGSGPIGNDVEYSNGDIAALNWLYPVKNCINFHNHIYPMPNVSQPLFYQAGISISSNTTIALNNIVTFDAGSSILLSPGFVAEEGATFRAVIDGCGGAVQSLSSEEALAWQAQTGTFEENLERRLSSEEGLSNPKKETGPAEPSLTAQPNPFTDEITIRATLGKAAPASLILLDISGRVVQNIDSQSLMDSGNLEMNLSLPNLAPGMYFLRMQYAEGVQTVKLVKQNRN